jgi:hypothetical protein
MRAAQRSLSVAEDCSVMEEPEGAFGKTKRSVFWTAMA